jgi:hypothetical protein
MALNVVLDVSFNDMQDWKKKYGEKPGKLIA